MSILKSKLFWLVLLLLIGSNTISLVLGNYLSLKSSPQISKNTLIPSKKIFSNQSATIRGKIIKVSQSQIIIQNNLGTTEEFKPAGKVYIKKYNPEGKEFITQNLSQIELNKDVIVNLELPQDLIGQKVNQTDYVIIAISYLPPLPKNITQPQKTRPLNSPN